MSKSRNDLPVIGITLGDPKGIGPEVVAKALKSRRVRRICRAVLFGDPLFFRWKRAASLTPRECGRLSGSWIEQAIRAALTGRINALVTAPISKEHLRLAGYPYPGHTEFLAARSHVRHVRMMMAGPRLKTVLVTIHEPFSKIARLLKPSLILKTIELADWSLRNWFGIRRPRLAVAALNPHAGESGIFGREERTIIAPAIRKAKGIDVRGPFAADTVFLRASRGEFDAVIALYHDQGMIPLKLLHFDRAVNITLGLPFIRTSVDHGTAFDIAGKGIADPSSMITAIETAVELTKRAQK